jgi:hypothetical protein
MPADAATTYIVAIPGTDHTQEMSRLEVLDKIAKGEMTPEYWVWSAPDQDWKQISQIRN